MSDCDMRQADLFVLERASMDGDNGMFAAHKSTTKKARTTSTLRYLHQHAFGFGEDTKPSVILPNHSPPLAPHQLPV